MKEPLGRIKIHKQLAEKFCYLLVNHCQHQTSVAIRAKHHSGDKETTNILTKRHLTTALAIADAFPSVLILA